MWIIRLALRRPYTFVVVFILILIMACWRSFAPNQYFHEHRYPVISIVWNYNALIPEDMSDRVVSVTERALQPPLITSNTSNRSSCMELRWSK
jgi:multidrug efflux pump subunit AcrB